MYRIYCGWHCSLHLADMISFPHNNPKKAFYYPHFQDKDIEAQKIELPYFPIGGTDSRRTECFLQSSSTSLLVFVCVRFWFWGLHLPLPPLGEAS